MTDLAAKNCVPCRGGTPPLAAPERARLQAQLDPAWRVVEERQLQREWRFPDFAGALAFTNRIGAVAEEQQHHPDIELGWGRVRVTLWTHDVGGLSENDFILAAKIDRLAAAP